MGLTVTGKRTKNLKHILSTKKMLEIYKGVNTAIFLNDQNVKKFILKNRGYTNADILSFRNKIVQCQNCTFSKTLL